MNMKENQHPHILILMTDQQRADCLSCLDHPVLDTPNMDRIAKEGTHYTQAISVSPVCMPARASFANGLYPHNHGMWKNQGEMPETDETFFHHLQKTGYYTSHIGKSHYYNHRLNEHITDRIDYMHSRGLDYVHETAGPWGARRIGSGMADYWEKKGVLQAFRDDYAKRFDLPRWYAAPSPHSEEDYQDSYVGMRAVEYIDSYDKDQPSCTFVGFGGPHSPFDAPGKYATMYNPADMPGPVPVSPGIDDLPEHVITSNYFESLDEMTPGEISEMQANYFGNVKLLDDWFGRILDAYERRGWLEDLVIVFWSDHGEMLGDHGKIEKSVFMESSLRVPLVVRWPGKVEAGIRSDALVEIIDVFPTLMEGLGLTHHGRCQGRSLLSADFGNAPGHECQLSEIEYCGTKRFMARTHRYKYAIDDKARAFLLFDMQEDPFEQNNLVGKAPELEAAMRDMLLERIVEAQYTVIDL
jgi:arylsulfatase